jgi:hypothetical protein
VFTLRNEPAALFKALSCFALRGLDLSKLESRPVPGRPWEYLFYADVSAAREDLQCSRAMVHLAEFAASLRTLGSYPRWREADIARQGTGTALRADAAGESAGRPDLTATQTIQAAAEHGADAPTQQEGFRRG